MKRNILFFIIIIITIINYFSTAQNATTENLDIIIKFSNSAIPNSNLETGHYAQLEYKNQNRFTLGSDVKEIINGQATFNITFSKNHAGYLWLNVFNGVVNLPETEQLFIVVPSGLRIESQPFRISYTYNLTAKENDQLYFKANGQTIFSDTDTVTKIAVETEMPGPAFSKEEGVYNNDIIVKLTPPITNAQIIYTMDGTDPNAEWVEIINSQTGYPEIILQPDTNSLKYDPKNQIKITDNYIKSGTNAGTTVKAITYYKPEFLASSVCSKKYILQVANPIIKLNSELKILITTKTQNTKTYYTIDGTNPVVGQSSEYSEAITVSENTIVKAIAYKEGNIYLDSDIVEYIYNPQ